MPVGTDQQYNLSWAEQDKIRRRIELKNRLKVEGVKKRYDPFLQLKGVIFSDPAIDRYMDLRKKGRMPGAPLKPHIFYGMIALIFVPIIALNEAVKYQRGPWLEKCSSGEITYAEREAKSIV